MSLTSIKHKLIYKFWSQKINNKPGKQVQTNYCFYMAFITPLLTDKLPHLSKWSTNSITNLCRTWFIHFHLIISKRNQSLEICRLKYTIFFFLTSNKPKLSYKFWSQKITKPGKEVQKSTASIKAFITKKITWYNWPT